jgi:hypothetical protein
MVITRWQRFVLHQEEGDYSEVALKLCPPRVMGCIGMVYWI